MLKRFFVMPMLLWVPATQASPDLKAPECVGRLNAMERMIYDAALTKVRSGAAPRNSVRAAAVALVREGKLPMRSAPAAAKTADQCLNPNNRK